MNELTKGASIASRVSVLALVGLFGASSLALALEPVNVKGGVAIHGYDPVAYFVTGRPVEGVPQLAFEWMDATWRFANAANRKRFEADPGKYAPQYGGYCAYAVGRGDTADIDPEAWTIVDDKLYLNYSKKIRERWEGDRAAYIESADRNWPGLLRGD